jgi:pyruvate dehydrogenase (quinone)
MERPSHLWPARRRDQRTHGGAAEGAVKYKLPIKIFILNNSLGMIKWDQMVFLGNPEYGCELQPIDFVAVARAFGAAGYRIDDPAAYQRTVAEALPTPGLVVVEAIVDPNEPPMPVRFAKSLAKGTPNRMKIVSTVAEDRVREMV